MLAATPPTTFTASFSTVEHTVMVQLTQIVVRYRGSHRARHLPYRPIGRFSLPYPRHRPAS